MLNKEFRLRCWCQLSSYECCGGCLLPSSQVSSSRRPLLYLCTACKTCSGGLPHGSSLWWTNVTLWHANLRYAYWTLNLVEAVGKVDHSWLLSFLDAAQPPPAGPLKTIAILERSAFIFGIVAQSGNKTARMHHSRHQPALTALRPEQDVTTANRFNVLQLIFRFVRHSDT